MNKTSIATAEKAAAISALQEMLKPGATVYTNLRKVSASGMTRHISVHIATEGAIEDITWLVGRAIGEKRDLDTGGLKISGCGMDMGFQIVYSLSAVLYREGFECIGDGEGYATRCPSNDHSNGDRDFTPHHHNDGGYALRHRWL